MWALRLLGEEFRPIILPQTDGTHIHTFIEHIHRNQKIKELKEKGQPAEGQLCIDIGKQ